MQIVGSNHWDRYEFDQYQREINDLTAMLLSKGVHVDQLGHVGREELPEVMRRTHIHVVPSRWDEPFGLTTLEGMATGLATVASDTGGTPEVIGDAGLLFRRDDAEHLAEHLWSLVGSPTRLADLQRSARDRALSFSWRSTWDQLQHATDNVCGRSTFRATA